VIRAITASDATKLTDLFAAELGGRQQARLGELVDVLALPGCVTLDADDVVGAATYAVDGTRAELAALAVTSTRRNEGIGGQLVEAVADAVHAAGATTLWLVTTNDNLDALRLYQRHGFRLLEVHVGGVDASRQLKPLIPALGDYGIPMHDELVLERRLD
jgi:ribosomal protein S18 acetylase RimI-like enzyme